MKINLTIAAVVIALTAQSNAASYIISNVVSGNGNADALYQNFDDSLLDGGIVALGYFTGGTPSSSLNDIATTISSFTLQASALTGSNSPSLNGSFAGYVEADIVNGGQITGSNSLIGQSMYVFVGNAATLETSTAWALASIGAIQDDVPFNIEYNANPLGVTPLIGSVGSFTGDASGFGSSTYTTLKLAVVPEPSAALLGAIGGVLLVLRRRRN